MNNRTKKKKKNVTSFSSFEILAPKLLGGRVRILPLPPSPPLPLFVQIVRSMVNLNMCIYVLRTPLLMLISLSLSLSLSIKCLIFLSRV